MHLFTPFVNHLETLVAHGGYAVIFITSILEGLPLIGSAVPGQTLVVLGGFLAKTHVLGLASVLVFAIGGAILGDGIAYALGAKYGYGFLDRLSAYLEIGDMHLAKARKLVAENTGKAIVLGRFNPITRMMMPFIVGASGARPGKFWLYDCIGCVIWAGGSVMLGFVFGVGYGTAAAYAGKFVVAGIIIAILLVWAFGFINKRWHIFVKYDLFTLGFMLLALYVTFRTIQDTASSESFMAALDVSVSAWMAAHIVPAMTSFMRLLTDALSPLSLSIATLLGSAVYMLRRNYKEMAFLLLSLLGVLGWTGFVKDLIARVRPEDGVLLCADFSFPSLHAAIAAFACVALVHLYFKYIHNIHAREAAIAITVLLSVAVAFSRVYLNVHWLSDVVAGYAIGVLWTTTMMLFVRYLEALVKDTPGIHK